MATTSDDFNRADSTDLGANWTPYTGANALQIVSTAVRRNTNPGWEKYTGGSPLTADQWGRITYDVLDAAAAAVVMGLLLRSPDTGTVDTGIGYYFAEDGAGIQNTVAGTPGAFLQQFTTTDAAGSHVLLGFARGPLLEMWYDGVRILAVRDSTITAGGRAGFYIDATAADDVEAELFEYGDITDRDFAADPDYLGVAGSAQNLTSAATGVVTLEHAIAAGELIVVAIACDNNGTNGVTSLTSVTDSDGNTYTLSQATQDPGAAIAGITAGLAYCVCTNPLSIADTVTVNFSPNTAAKAIIVHHWQNIDQASPVSVAATTTTGSSTTPSISRTPLAATDLFVGVLAIEGPTNSSYTEDTDTTDGNWYTLPAVATTSGTAATNAQVNTTIKRVTGTTAQTWGPTLGTSRDWAMVAIVFKKASTARPRTPSARGMRSMVPHYARRAH